jgi:hypothetical protein
MGLSFNLKNLVELSFVWCYSNAKVSERPLHAGRSFALEEKMLD